MEIGMGQALLIALAAYLGSSTWFFGVGYFTVYRPLIGGTIVGLILGDVVTGMKLGAAINAIYLGFISTGGSLPSDLIFAGYIGTALGMVAGLDAPTALSLVVPLGLLGSGIWFFRMSVDSLFVHWADAFARRGSTRGVAATNVWPGQILLLLLYGIPAFIIVYYGSGAVESLISAVPPKLVEGLAMVGGMLPAIGIGMLLDYMARWRLVPFFLLGFLLAVYLQLPTLVIALVGLIAAVLHVQYSGALETVSAPDEAPSPQLPPPSERRLVTRRDMLGAWFRWLTFSHSSYNYERLQGLGFAHSMTPIIARLYKTREDIAAALQRHLVFFNTEPNVGAVVHGVTVAMEEQRASGATQITDDAINSVKSGLMGPLAGIGDSMTQGLITPTLLALGIGLAEQGNLAGPILYVLLESAAIVGISYFTWMQGYRWGRTAVERILQAGLLQPLTEGASVLGLTVVGALTATVVQLSTKLSITVGPQTVLLQTDVLDPILKGLLPLSLTVLVWWLLKRKKSPLAVILVVFAVGLTGTWLGWLGWS
ncbi:MAG: PTS system mannose/fructose/sorbose family transporter subunit IID [Anaerolineales bacterium]|nr:MAG: PTS system mannose/fructose/sorbose family transporter subunit IID [Anaerolineales bacterium]